MTSPSRGPRLAELRRDYLVAFLRYLPRREEAALAAGYELGRSALRLGISSIDLVQIHHDVLAEVLTASRLGPTADSMDAAVARIVELAGDFLSEVVAAGEMTQRAMLAPTPSRRSGDKPGDAPTPTS